MRQVVRGGALALDLALAATGARAGPPAAPRSVPDAPYPEEFRKRVNDEIEIGASALLGRLETCFQLLFLRRASFKTTVPVITPSDPEPSGGGDPAK
jgi:hypothetical protein